MLRAESHGGCEPLLARHAKRPFRFFHNTMRALMPGGAGSGPRGLASGAQDKAEGPLCARGPVIFTTDAAIRRLRLNFPA